MGQFFTVMCDFTMPKTISFPFELPSVADPFFVDVPPKIAAVMNAGNAEEKQAIALIAPKLEQKDNRWGFLLPRKFGLTMAERTALQKASEIDRETTKKSLKLLKKIQEDTGKSINDIQAEMAKLGANAEFPEWFMPFIEECLEFEQAFSSKPPIAVFEANIYIQRLIPSFTVSHTLALHPRILEQVMTFREEENQPIEDEPMGESMEAMTSEAS